MKWMHENQSLDAFFECLHSAEKRLLITDYDGTIAPFVFDRNRVRSYPDVIKTLRKIIDNNYGRVVMVTGRPIASLEEQLNLNRPVEIWGTFGWERKTVDGHYHLWPITAEHMTAMGAVEEWMHDNDLHVHSEQKPASIALHWRGAGVEEAQAIAEMAIPFFEKLATKNKMISHAFDGGIELRVPGRDKGDAISALLEEAGDDTVIACIGDDSTDEDAFKALGDRGLRVLVRTVERPTAADLWLRPPRELNRFLKRWLEAIEMPTSRV